MTCECETSINICDASITTIRGATFHCLLEKGHEGNHKSCGDSRHHNIVSWEDLLSDRPSSNSA